MKREEKVIGLFCSIIWCSNVRDFIVNRSFGMWPSNLFTHAAPCVHKVSALPFARRRSGRQVASYYLARNATTVCTTKLQLLLAIILYQYLMNINRAIVWPSINDSYAYPVETTSYRSRFRVFRAIIEAKMGRSHKSSFHCDIYIGDNYLYNKFSSGIQSALCIDLYVSLWI